MNDPSSYGEFESKIDGLYDDLWNLAKKKVEIEREAIKELGLSGVMAPIGFIAADCVFLFSDAGDLDACEYEATKKKIDSFVKTYCFSRSPVEEAVYALTEAEEMFDIGSELDGPNGLSESLALSWPSDTNETARLFRENYVAPISDVKGKQEAAITLARGDLEAIPGIVGANRESLEGILNTTIDKLGEFDPRLYVGAEFFHYQLFAWSLITPDPVTGRGASLADLALAGLTDKEKLWDAEVGCTAHFFAALRGAIDTVGEKAKEVLEGCYEVMNDRITDLEDKEDKLVMKRPGLNT